MTETENSVDGVVLSPVLRRWLDDVTALWDEIAKRDARLIELEAQVSSGPQADPAVIEELNQLNADLTEEVAGRTRDIDSLRLTVSGLEGKVSEAIAAREQAEEREREAVENTRLAGVRITEITDEHARELSVVSEKARLDLAEVKRVAEDARIEADRRNAETERKAEAARVEADRKYNDMHSDFTTRIREQDVAHQLATAEAKDKADKELSDTKALHERETAYAKQRHEDEVSRLVRKHESDVAALVAEHTAIVDGMQRRYDALENYLPLVASENQQIGKTKGIAVASAYIDAAQAEEADIVRVKKLAAGLVPPVVLSVDPRTQPMFAEPVEAAFVSAPVVQYVDERQEEVATESEVEASSPGSDFVTEPQDNEFDAADEFTADQPSAEPFSDPSVGTENGYVDEDEDEDEFSVGTDTPVVEEVATEQFAAAPVADSDDSYSGLPAFNPEQYSVDTFANDSSSEEFGGLPVFNPADYADEKDDEPSALPTFNYEAEETLPVAKVEPEEETESALPKFDPEEFSFARKLQ